MEMLKQAILQALEDKYNAQISEADATIKIYLERPVGIGEHPQHLEEIDKLLQKIVDAQEKLNELQHFKLWAIQKKGTGKKPKGSGRRLYTDENPKDTVGIKFATPADARATVAKVKRVNKPFARKIQILTVMEQRAKVMGKSKVVAIAKKGKEAIRRGRK